MSLNLCVATKDFIACVTDRRLTDLNGRIVSERSMKLTGFVCQTARGLVTYNGIGLDARGETPNDWLSEIHDVATLDLDQLCKRIKLIAESKIRDQGKHFPNPRHSFIVVAFCFNVPCFCMISNYESLTDEREEATARNAFDIGVLGPRRASAYAAISTGDRRGATRTIRDRLIPKLRDRAPSEEVVSLMVKAVRDASYGQGRKGTVGTSVVSGYWPAAGNLIVNDHIVGGSTIGESPNFLGPGFIIRDAYHYTDPSDAPQYDRVRRRSRIEERPCWRCGAPVPQGSNLCGVCDAPTRRPNDSR